MINRFLFLFLMGLLVFNINAFQWPVSEISVLASFGQNEFGSFLKGINLGGSSQDVKALDSGELVFYSHQGGSPMDLPSGLGTYVIYQHNNGIRSLYGHLQDNSIHTEKLIVGLEDVIGKTGNTGMDSGSMLYLQLIDTEFKKYINPLLSLPLLNDQCKPLIKNVYILSRGKKIILNSKTKIESGVFGLFADIRDSGADTVFYNPLAPFSISLYLNGENLANINFESLKVVDGIMLLEESDGISYEELYKNDWEYFLGKFEFNPGDVMIEISVKDFSGNEGVKLIPLKITD